MAFDPYRVIEEIDSTERSFLGFEII